MASLQDEVKKVCDLADEVLTNPSRSIKDTAMIIGLGPFLTGLGSAIFVTPLSPIIIATWAAKKMLNRKRHEEEKERMLREVIRKQQAVIDRLNEELARARQQNAKNRQEIENLKKILRMLEETEKQLNAA